uniref:DUF5641 domain-containing protein n=1 Tax=Heligmosomoides polygyrus TaxID=6339 RepID=A0A183F9L8_HELPZ
LSPQQSEEFLTGDEVQGNSRSARPVLGSVRTPPDSVKNARSNPSTPHVGDVVLLTDDISRGKWNYGMTDKVHLGKDSSIRCIDVRTPNGKTLTRSVSALYPLEITSATAEPSAASDKTGQKLHRTRPYVWRKPPTRSSIPIGPPINITFSVVLANIRK